jgi:hypothetical protein
VIQSRKERSSARDAGSTDTNRPRCRWMWSMFSRVASLESATYKKFLLPTRSTRWFQVSMWVVSSPVLPSATR